MAFFVGGVCPLERFGEAEGHWQANYFFCDAYRTDLPAWWVAMQAAVHVKAVVAGLHKGQLDQDNRARVVIPARLSDCALQPSR
jgi:hypothetical protein